MHNILVKIVCAQVVLRKTYINIVNRQCNNVNSDLTFHHKLIFKDGVANK